MSDTPEVSFTAPPDFSNLKQWEMSEIMAGLASMPRSKWNYGQEVIRTRETLDLAKYNYERTKAKWQTVASSQKDSLGLSSEADRKAYVLEQDEVIAAEHNLVEANVEHEKAKLAFEYCDDLFISLRKVASIIEEQEKAQAAYAKYADPNRPDDENRPPFH